MQEGKYVICKTTGVEKTQAGRGWWKSHRLERAAGEVTRSNLGNKVATTLYRVSMPF